MRVPESVARAYEEERAVVEAVRKYASSRLRILAANNSWLFDDRIKSAPGEHPVEARDRPYVATRHGRDLYAAMLVVPTQKHVRAASDAVLRSLNGELRPARDVEASLFRVRRRARNRKLRGKVSPGTVSHPAVLDRQFEIQIHTGVQYAWWRATHDELYKGSSCRRLWAARRASGQARASLELIDGILADFEAAARLQRNIPQGEDPGETARGWLAHWSRASRPADEIRFASTASAIARTAEVELNAIAQRLSAGDLQPFVSARITPVQVILVACHLIGGDAIFPRFLAAHHRLLITDELLAAYPPLDGVPFGLRVSI